MFVVRNALFHNDDDCSYTRVDVKVAEGRIVSVSPHDDDSAEDADADAGVVDATDCLLLPGLVNAHAHSSEHWLRGAIGAFPLELWLDPLVRASPLAPDAVRIAAQATAVEAALSGCTSVVDHLFVPPGNAGLLDAAVQGFADVGVRLFLAPMVGDVPSVTPANFPRFFAGGSSKAAELSECEEWARPVDETIRFLEEVISRHHRPESGVSVLVAPSGVQWCSTAMLVACIELAKRRNLPLHMHLLETAFQRQLAAERPDSNGATSAVEFLSRLGGLSRTTSFAHAVHVSDSDIATLAASGATVVHNPLSNLRLGSGIAPILAMREAGVNVSLGADGAASNDSQNMFEVLKQTALLHNVTTPDYDRWLRPSDVVAMATSNAARALGAEAEIGRIAPGMRADFSLVNLRSLSMLPRTDPLALLVLGRPEKDALRGVWVGGRRIVSDGAVVGGFDMQALRQGLWQLAPFTPGSALLKPLPDYEAGYRSALERSKKSK